MSLTERLIELVKIYPILYDLGNPEYKNIRKRDKIWDKIGTELNESGDEVKKKWKNLRDSYAKYLKSIKTRTGQSAKRNYKNWQWACLMESFKPYLAFAKTDSNITGPVYDIKSPGDTVELSDSSSNVEIETENIIEQHQTKEGNNALKDINEETTLSDGKELQISTPSTSKSIIRRNNKGCQRNSSSVDTVIDYLKNKKIKTESPTDMIFLGYSQILQSFSPRRQAHTKMKIAEIMTEQECLHLEELAFQGNSHSTSSTNNYTSLRSPDGSGSLQSATNSLPMNERIPVGNLKSPEEGYSIMVLSEEANSHYDINPAGSFLHSYVP